jgi:ribosomal protein S18 acetylase RimI-like enzyme
MALPHGFPVPQAAPLAAPPTWAARSLGLRHASAADAPFLRWLFGQTRADELAMVPWLPDMVDRFLDDQFALQHRHYVNHFAAAHFLILELANQSIGRLYVDKSDLGYHIIDISIAAAQQGKGLGSELIAHLQGLGRRENQNVWLHVNAHNVAARRLYERLGFRILSEEGAYLAMRWTHDHAAPASRRNR